MKNRTSFAAVRGLIREKYGTQSAFALALGMDYSTLSKKLCQRVEWTRDEMEKVCKLLGKTKYDVPELFFYQEKL